MSATTYGWLVLAFPLAGMLIIALGWRLLPGRLPGWIGTTAIFLSFLASIGALVELLDRPEDERVLVDSAWTYAATGDFSADLAILVDPLSVFMCLVVSGVSFLIHLYSVAYMSGDRGYARYFAYLNLFVFSMLLLVLAANFLILIIGWAFVGAASYLLISFWYRRETAVRAGIKAFVINVIGDVALVVAAFLILDNVSSLDFLTVFDDVDKAFDENDGTLVAASLLILVGAFAKSAQLPLHTWLPDAMEGPTPVSALIHAATMVTAGVYLIARMHPLFELAPAAADVGAIVGCATLVFAGTVAVVGHRPEAGDRVFHDLADRLHGDGRVDCRVWRGALPPHDPCVLQGALVHGRGLGDRRDGRHPGHGSHGWLPARDAVHLHHIHHRGTRTGGLPAHRRVLLEGRDPRLRDQPRRPLRSTGDLRVHRRLPHGLLRVPDGLPGVPRGLGAGGARARGRAPGAR